MTQTPPPPPSPPAGPGGRKVPIGTTSDDPRSSRCSAAPAAGPLAPGAAAPPFALRRGPHRAAALADFRGRPLVLAFYVADWHPVCTAQLERLRSFGCDAAQGYLFGRPQAEPVFELGSLRSLRIDGDVQAG